jgi:phosphatidylserine decarboxylase
LKRLPIASDAWRFVIPLVVIGILFIQIPVFLSPLAGVVCLLLAVFCLFFFRDPDRPTAIDERRIYSPADGTVLEVSTVKEGPHAGWNFIRIFLSVLNNHVQRSPVHGTIEKIAYKKGLFLDARHVKAHVDNEQNEVTFKTPKGDVIVTQIAGLIARRIVCWSKTGDTLEQGQRFGLIRFGSQVDVLVPPSTIAKVKPGDVVVGGDTVLLEWN